MGKSKRVKITSVKSSAGKLSPLLVKFEHGEVDPDSFQNWKSKFKIGLSENDRENNTEPQLKVKIKSDVTTYSSYAKSLDGIGVRQDPYYSYYIGLRNKKEESMKVYEIEQVTVAAAKAKAPPTQNSVLLQAQMNMEKPDDPNETINDLAKTKAAAKKHLVSEFGQKKGRRIYEQADRMQVEAENLEKKLLKAAETVSDDVLEAPPTDNPNETIDTRDSLLPPCNRNAKTVQGVYNVNDILTENDKDELLKSARELSEKYPDKISVEKAIKHGPKEGVFTEILGSALRQNSDWASEDRVAVAVYMEGIVTFINLRSNQLVKGVKSLPDFLPLSIKNKIFETFTDDSRVTPESKDRATCYIMVLGLIINNYSLDFSIISNSLKFIKMQALKKLVNLIGAHWSVDPRTKRGMINLKLPLTDFDPNKIARRRKT